MTRPNSPWNWQVPVTASDGTATPEFLAWLKDQLTTYQIAASAVPSSRQILAGTGLLGGGDLTLNRTLTLNAGLSNLLDVDLSTAPTDTQVLSWYAVPGKWKPRAGSQSLEVDYNGGVILNPVNKINFTGTGVVVTTPSAGQVNVAIAGGGGGGSAIYAPLTNGDPGPVLIDNGAGACVMVDIS